MSEEALTDAQMDELVQMISVLFAQDRYTEVLRIWSEYFVMLFREQRTKDKQAFEIRGALNEQEEIVKARAALADPDDRDISDAAELMAIQFIRPIVCQAFDFSTYSGSRRCSYIRSALQVEIDAIEAKVNPLRHIMDQFQGVSDEPVSD